MKKHLFTFIFLIISIVVQAIPLKKVWLDGSIVTEKTKLKHGSVVFFSQWSDSVEEILASKDISVALRLDHSFDPIPTDSIQLPSLRVLSALDNAEILDNYFKKLIKFSHSKGIQYLVLPDSNNVNSLEKKVITKASTYSDFFIPEQHLFKTTPTNRKEYESIKEENTILIVDSNKGFRKIKRWNKKEVSIPRLKRPILSNDFSFGLDKIKLNTISLIDPHNQLPIRRRSVTYLGNNEKLRNRLSQYLNVLNHREIDVLTIYDDRISQTETAQKSDILIRSFKQKNDTLKQPALIIAEIGTLSDIELCKMLFGAREIVGKSLHPQSKTLPNYHYLAYSEAKVEGIDTSKLAAIDTIAAHAIREKASPGLKLMVVKDGSVVFNKSYGHLTYDSITPVNTKTLYDIASVTKVAATLPAVAWLVETGQIGLDDSVSQYIPEIHLTDKSGTTIRQLLSHNGGLISYASFWKMAMRGNFIPSYMRKEKKQVPLTYSKANLMKIHAKDSIIKYIGLSETQEKPFRYKYSDLGFILLQTIVERVTKEPFESFVYSRFYQPMGLHRTGFKPLEKGFDPKNIAPTEMDTLFRGGLAWGEVHDRNAYLLGGVAGHAGLFSDAEGLAKIMYMFCNNGYYGGKQYLTEKTLSEFNKRHFEKNRRGLGWDKHLTGKQLTQSSLASDQSFGHTGFTGTIVWADPKHDLIYIFLSNRTYTGSNNWKLNLLRTRTLIHDTIYQSLTSAKN